MFKAKDEVKAPAEEIKTSSALATKGNTDLTVYDYGDDAGAGMQDVRMDERKLPFMRILDPKSPQCKPPAAGGLPGAKGGALLNTSASVVYDGTTGFDFLPCWREEKYIEYIQREEDGSGGGFVAVHEWNAPIVLSHRAHYGKFGKMLVVSDEELEKCKRDPKYSPVPLLDEKHKAHELVQTFSLYGIVRFSDDLYFRAIVSFASTQIPKYQGFIDRYDSIRYGGIKPPLWAHWLHLTTQYESKGGFSWYGWVVRFKATAADGTDDQLGSRLTAAKNADGSYKDQFYGMGREFFQMIERGEAKVDYAAATERQPGDDEDALPE